MTVEQLNNNQLYQAVIAGCYAIIKKKKDLNAINVFPVADGDTGDNLSATAEAIIAFSKVGVGLKATMESVADASIIGARGNSGVLFSQFVNSFAKHLNPGKTLLLAEFSEILRATAQEVRMAIEKPVAGTMLTIIECFAEFAAAKQHYASFTHAMIEILPLLEAQVQATQEALAVLKQNKVVDAGALGFYGFVAGFTQYLKEPRRETVSSRLSGVVSRSKHTLHAQTLPVFRYCTEAVLKGESFSKKKLLHLLNEEGDSALVSGNERISRFHIHTNNPAQVFAKLINHYKVQYPKVDDMQRQFEIHHQRKHKVALVTDSSADLPEHLLDRYQVIQIPLNIHLGEHQFLDRYSFKLDEFYEKLDGFSDYPKTSSPAPWLIAEKLTQLAGLYEHVIVLSVAKAMSGTYAAFVAAAQHLDNITVIDTKTTSGAHGLLLKYAGELIESGLDATAVIDKIQKAVDKTVIFVAVEQFSSMIRSGRINKFTGRIASFTGIKPIISIDEKGKGYVKGKCFSFNDALNRIVSMVHTRMQQSGTILADYCIIHAGAAKQATSFSALTDGLFDKPPAYIEPVSLAIGLHAGKGCIALAARMKPGDN